MNTTITVDSVHSKALPDLVAKLLTARQESLACYHRLAAMKPFTLADPVRHLLRRFRQTLVDYLAIGPFEVFDALEEQSADSPYQPARELARKLYARIACTTQAALAFHDRYDEALADLTLARLDEDLSRLGEALAARIELEDQIVTAIRQSRKTAIVA